MIWRGMDSPLAALLARGAIGSLAVRLASVGLVFGLQVLLARVLGVDEYGRYVYVLAWF
jgi:O-antigen/teichoic acid export membrane protein